MSRRKVIQKIVTALVFMVLLAGLLVLLFSGDNEKIIYDIFSGESLETILSEVQSLGWRGMVVFGALSMLQVVVAFLPAEPVQVLSGISYGLWVGVGICTVGVILGNTIIYVLYRVYGDRLSNYFKKKIEVDLDVLGNSKRITLMIFILYFLPAIPYGLICFFASSVNNKYLKYITVTTLGAIPSIFIGVGLGHLAINVSWIISLVVLAVLIIVLIVLYCNRAKVFAKANEFVKKQFNYSSKTKVQKPNALFNAIIFCGLKLWLKSRVKCKIKRNIKKLETPAIVLCNHGSFIDFMYFSTILRRDKPHVVSTRQYFYEKRLGKLLKKLGCIPKSMFTADMENVKNCLQVIKDNGVLVICPEARLSTAGQFEDVQPGTMSFLRKMGANATLYTIKFGGDYLAMPKWARHGNKRYVRKGSVVEAELSVLYEKGESTRVSLEEFEAKVMSVLDYNDFDWLKEHPEMHYPQGNLAVGLDNILYRCPKCNSEFTLTASGNTVTCNHCGYTDTMDDRYEFTSTERSFANHQEWYNWQMSVLKQQIESDPNFELKDKVELKHPSIGGATQMCTVGQGTCVFNRQGLTYTGTVDGKEIVKFFPMSTVYRLLFGAGEDFEIYEGEKLWYFIPEDRRTCVKWYMASMILGQH